MICDEAFEQLTDPALANRDELEQHLQQCPRCRDMAEVLSPALRYFPQREPDAFSHEPAVWTTSDAHAGPFLSTEAVHVAEAAATQLASQNRTRRNKWRDALFAAAVILPPIAMGAVLVIALADRPRATVLSTDPCTRLLAAHSQTGKPDSAVALVQSCNDCHAGTH